MSRQIIKEIDRCFPDEINWDILISSMQFTWLDDLDDYNDFFHPTVCHICKRPLIDNSISCNYCHMVFYCTDLHRSKHFVEHRTFCALIRQHSEEQRSRSVTVYTPEWIYKRYELLYQVSQSVGYNLPLDERQMIIFPKSCYECHRQIGLHSCQICLSENYCEEHAEGFIAHHRSKCKMLKLSLLFKIIRLKHSTKYIVFSRFPKKEKSYNDMEDFIKNYICSQSGRLIWHIKSYIHSDYVSGPLTLYNVMRELHLLDVLHTRKDNIWSEECVIHIISTNSLDKKYIKSWELLLHLFHHIKHLTIVLIGTGLQEEKTNILLCFTCTSHYKQILTLECYPITYSAYAATSFFQPPNVILTFQVHFHPALEGLLSDNILTIYRMKCPYILTAGSQNIMEQNIRSIRNILNKNINPIYSAANIWKSHIPCRILDTDCVGYRNAYVTIYKDLGYEKRPSQMYQMDFSTLWSSEWLDNINRHEFFHPDICHVCKRNTGNLIPCDDCYMISYCGEAHKSQNFSDHKQYCTFIKNYLQNQSTEWRSLCVTTSRWFQNRHEFLKAILEHFSNELPRYVMQMIIFAKSCYNCHRQINLKSCNTCYSENYCEEHQNSFENHHTASRCQMLKLSLYLKTLNINFNDFITFISFPDEDKSVVNMIKFIEDYVFPYTHINVEHTTWAVSEYAHSDYVSVPLTLYDVMKKNYLLQILYSEEEMSCSQCVIHVIGSSVEKRYMGAWEILLHLLKKIKHLIIILTGKDLKTETFNVSLCDNCTGRKQLTVECYPAYKPERFHIPNVIIIPQAHFSRGVPAIWNWIDDIRAIQNIFKRALNCVFIVTAGSENIAEENTENILSVCRCARPIYSALNTFKSYIPYRLMHNDRVGYRNAYVTIYDDLKSKREEELSQICQMDFSTLWSYEQLNTINRHEFFHPDICHVCKRNTGNLILCNDCYMISYCGEAHKSQHFSDHKQYCTFIKHYLQNQSTEWRSLYVTTPRWFQKRHEFLKAILEHFSNELPRYVMQMIIFAKSCYDCHRQINLKSCNICYCENYCDEHQSGFENHHTVSKCQMLMLSLYLKIVNLNFNDFITFISFPDEDKPIVDMNKFIDDYVSPYSHRNIAHKTWTVSEYAHSDYVSAPLTLYNVMRENDLLHILYSEEEMSCSQCVIHIIGSSVEKRYMGAWEILLHLLKNVNHLIIILTGKDLKTETFNVSLCDNCTGRKQLTVVCYSAYKPERFYVPNVIIIPQAHFSRGVPAIWNWIDDIRAIQNIFKRALNCLLIVTAGSENIAEENTENILSVCRCARPIYSALNTFKSYIPYRLMHNDRVGHRNAYVTIWKNLKELKESGEPQASTSKVV